MNLSSAYIYEKLNEKYWITQKSALSETDGFLRPFLFYSSVLLDMSEDDIKSGHICVVVCEDAAPVIDFISDRSDVFWIFCLKAAKETSVFTDSALMEDHSYLCITADGDSSPAELMNDLQLLFDRFEEWEAHIHELMLKNAGVDLLLRVTSEFLENPLLVMGLDFSLEAEAGREYLPEKARLYTEDGLNMEYMNALLGDPAFQNMAQSHNVILFSAALSGCRSLNRNLFIDGKATHRLVLTECRSKLSAGDTAVLNELSSKLEFLLSHQEEKSNPDYDMEQLFLRILSDRTADYVQVSRKLGEFGWSASHSYMCLILQITYINSQNLSTKAICRYIKKQFDDSVSFLYEDEIVVFFDLSLLKMTQQEIASKLIYFIRDSYLKAGYSRTMKGHMNLRRQYVQSRTALDVGSRKKPYLWIHYFDQVAMTYILEQSTRRLPGNMICHEGLLALRAFDAENHSDYMNTLKVFLDQHLSATLAARELFIHRSTFLYRLDKIREILQADLDDPDEIFYLELSFRILEQESEKS